MLIWIFLGVILLILELLSLSFFIAFFGIGALCVALCLFFVALPLYSQVLLFGFTSLLLLLLFKKIFKPKKNFISSPSETSDIIDAVAIVHADISPHALGKVYVGDTLWNATSSVTIHKGSEVKIISQKNLILEVRPL